MGFIISPSDGGIWSNVNTNGASGVYDEAKSFMEIITIAYRIFYQFKTRVIRIFNTFGLRMRLINGRALPEKS